MYYEDHILTMLGLVSPDQPTTYRKARAERLDRRERVLRPNPSNIDELRLSILRQAGQRGIKVRMDKETQSLTVTDTSRQWFIHISPDAESLAYCEDEPFASPAFNAAGKINDPELGPAVDREFRATDLNAHYDAVGRWINSYRAMAQGFPTDTPGEMSPDGEIHYQDSKPEMDYDGFDGSLGLSFTPEVDYHC